MIIAANAALPGSYDYGEVLRSTSEPSSYGAIFQFTLPGNTED
jgi:hypothetical protein